MRSALPAVASPATARRTPHTPPPRRLSRTANACSRCPIAPDPSARINQALNQARQNPATVGGRKATSGWVFYALVSALYSENRWPDLADAIDAVIGGDPRGVFTLADDYAERTPDGHYSNLFDALSTVSCTDDDHPPTKDQVLLTEIRDLLKGRV